MGRRTRAVAPVSFSCSGGDVADGLHVVPVGVSGERAQATHR
ncbi:hypothetical protein B005_2644 [Nocardiopsis alba ATCC BAA-2165]|uniref:Uncharacterized protein n=1 Tax=Nocardiopsis alba (strain ATCC BAA-2165 / BE74) TaxID=1205910 RepID=J7L3C4_NOCAA|nr:hypothetical protein B005_2644 [Nocardiopsis alba ATCC BAA-2165]